MYAALRQALLKNPFIHGDETTVRVFKESGRKAQNTSYMWVCQKRQSGADVPTCYRSTSRLSDKTEVHALRRGVKVR
ncbi:IS66 family transposase [Massilia sp. S19_KUP03_FR1]|uniref:IS66 family transposase n=1 Tax=Massilia sp. S19_KUP03_FR1 TaxID=3025503 RepID=UPI003FA58ED0